MTRWRVYLLYSLLLVPDKLDLKNSEIINTKYVYLLTSYLLQTEKFISKYNSEKSNK